MGISKRRNLLRNMEPMSGFEPLTYALRTRTRARRKVIDVAAVAETPVVCVTVGPSIQFRFV
jgi:hypothetical protein